ncbi:hypothetical protein EOK75_19435 (plasmid) [Pseudorhodobacter turbinis]|uniref:Uncharacterized protein n=1 Tax=Pseudorhodobacter turbinis TaxID=2500533 RepID=A0A4P8EL98_9RHOB|nr:hypothetical protein EOK75_19435 [Pseudorhodobacter turbinis]
MIEFRTLPNDHLDLAQSPLLCAALLTLQCTQVHRFDMLEVSVLDSANEFLEIVLRQRIYESGNLRTVYKRPSNKVGGGTSCTRSGLLKKRSSRMVWQSIS